MQHKLSDFIGQNEIGYIAVAAYVITLALIWQDMKADCPDYPQTNRKDGMYICEEGSWKYYRFDGFGGLKKS